MPSGIEGPQLKFSLADIRKAGYGAIWHGQKAWNGVAILSSGTEPVETRRGVPGDPEDLHSRYIEAAAGGLTIGCLYLPNGNPAPGPKFDYKARSGRTASEVWQDAHRLGCALHHGGRLQRNADRPGRACTGALA
jgi:exodeoxyribonuclease-3